MKAILRVERKTWLRGMENSKLKVEALFPSFASYGPPRSSWGQKGRVLDDGLLYFIVAGGMRARMPRLTLEMGAGDLFMLAPGVRHDFELLPADHAMTLYHMRLRASFGRRACWLREDALCFRHALGLRPYFDKMMEEADRKPGAGDRRMQALFFLIFGELFRNEENKGPGFSLAQQAKLRRFVRSHIYRQPRPEEMAAELNLSAVYFTRRFKETYRMSPREWLLKERLRVASLELLETQESIQQVAERMGYRNLNLFSRQFSREFGQSPRLFRQERSYREFRQDDS